MKFLTLQVSLEIQIQLEGIDSHLEYIYKKELSFFIFYTTHQRNSRSLIILFRVAFKKVNDNQEKDLGADRRT